MKRSLLAAGVLATLTANLLGQGLRNEIAVTVPKDSMVRLVEVAYAQAEALGLQVKAIAFRTVFHPGDTAAAVVAFKERPLGDEVYEFTEVLLTNKAWPKRRGGVALADYLAQLPPASPAWVVEGPPSKAKKLKLAIQGKTVFVSFGNELPAKNVGTYVEKFVEWAKTAAKSEPPPLPPAFRASEISRVEFDKEKQTVVIWFDAGLSGTGYEFDVSGGKFRFVGMASWVS